MNAPQRRQSARPGPSNNLRTQLFAHALLSVVLPITISGALVFFILSHLIDNIETKFARSRDAYTSDIARTELMAQARNAALQIDSFFASRISEAKGWASSRVVTDAALAAHIRHVAEGLTRTAIKDVENRFRTQKSLNTSPEADEYLRRQVASSPYFTEVFMSDRNGFNVALTDSTSEFVHSDEIWWQDTWKRGMTFGNLEYGDVSGLWSIDIAVRIDEPATNDPIGVMSAILAIESIQEIADWTAKTTRGGHVNVATSGGLLIAETSSGHAPERIMNADIDLLDEGDPSIRPAFLSTQPGYTVGQDWLTGYARTGTSAVGDSSTGRFANLDWLVILRKPVALVHKPNNALRAIDGALNDWRRILALTIAAAILLSALFAIALSSGAARRYTNSLRAIRELAEHTAQGKNVDPAVIDHPEEIARLNDAVHRLCRVFKVVINRSAKR